MRTLRTSGNREPRILDQRGSGEGLSHVSVPVVSVPVTQTAIMIGESAHQEVRAGGMEGRFVGGENPAVNHCVGRRERGAGWEDRHGNSSQRMHVAGRELVHGVLLRGDYPADRRSGVRSNDLPFEKVCWQVVRSASETARIAATVAARIIAFTLCMLVGWAGWKGARCHATDPTFCQLDIQTNSNQI